ncbi:MAG: hypothetical protein FJ279_28755 [Planctomycetes bacterium]|nr:hypothetical protein [Planctomycetota bacterium]
MRSWMKVVGTGLVVGGLMLGMASAQEEGRDRGKREGAGREAGGREGFRRPEGGGPPGGMAAMMLDMLIRRSLAQAPELRQENERLAQLGEEVRRQMEELRGQIGGARPAEGEAPKEVPADVQAKLKELAQRVVDEWIAYQEKQIDLMRTNRDKAVEAVSKGLVQAALRGPGEGPGGFRPGGEGGFRRPGAEGGGFGGERRRPEGGEERGKGPGRE